MDYLPPESAIYSSVDEVGISGFNKQADLAQYGGSDYSNAVRVERGITLDEAFAIAGNDSSVDYFVYLKGECMVLPLASDVAFDPASDPLSLVSSTSYTNDEDGSVGSGYCRVFYHGDTVFFSNEGQWLGTAPGLADTYSKEESVQRVEPSEEAAPAEDLDTAEEAATDEDVNARDEIGSVEELDDAEEAATAEDVNATEEVATTDELDTATKIVFVEEIDTTEEVVQVEELDETEE